LLIMGVIAAAVTSVLYSVQRTYERESYRSQSNDQARLAVEQLEGRDVPATFAPAQLAHAYGFDLISFTDPNGTVPGDGRGQTIAIVDAFDDPNIAADLQTFNTRYGLNNPLFTFTKATPFGTPPANANWALEMALDVEWAHAIAPAANILLVEAAGDTDAQILAAVDYAANYHDPVTGLGVAAVSMSWGFNEFSAQTDAAHDGHFAGHPGVTFVGASGACTVAARPGCGTCASATMKIARARSRA